MPQRGYGLQPRVAASATLGKESELCPQPQRGCVCFVHFLSEPQPRCGWNFFSY